MILYLIQVITLLYSAILFVIHPLYYGTDYGTIGVAKFSYFRNIAIVTFLLLGILLLAAFIDYKKNQTTIIARTWSITDWCMIIYLLSNIVSFLHSPYKEVALWGFEGWYMGLVTQVMFVFSYFMVSRFIEYKRCVVYLVFASAAITHIIAILQRFMMDPLGLYEMYGNNGNTAHYSFLSTIGNANWYSSYLCLIFALAVGVYLNLRLIKEKILLSLYLVIASISLVTQYSDSAFFALGSILVLGFLYSLSDRTHFRRFLEVCFMIVGGFLIAGTLQGMLSHQQEFWSREQFGNEISMYFSQNIAMKILFVILVILYLVLYYYKTDIKISWNIKRICCIIVFMLGVILITVMSMLMIFVSTDQVPESISFINKFAYLRFDESWGNARGLIWMDAAKMFYEYPITYKLFGCGPDAFASYAYELYHEHMIARWEPLILTNAHNEWFTILLNSGMAGMISYTGIFFTMLCRCIKYSNKKPVLIGIALCVIGYMAHNMFCYQQVCSTPHMFIVLGIGEKIIRHELG